MVLHAATKQFLVLFCLALVLRLSSHDCITWLCDHLELTGTPVCHVAEY